MILQNEALHIVISFIRKTQRTYEDKAYTKYYLLVRSVHTPKGPRQKVICSLGAPTSSG